MRKDERIYITELCNPKKTDSGLGIITTIRPPVGRKLSYGFAPTLWIDFLNADPLGIYSMWTVYSKFANSIRDFERRSHTEIDGIRLLSKTKFMKTYPLELQADAQKLHISIRRQIGESVSEDIPDDEPNIPSVPEEISIEYIKTNLKRLHLPGAESANFWLAVIHEGMEIARGKDGKIDVRRCQAPDCNKYFVPAPYSHNQIYHSETCRNRTAIREWRRTTQSS